MIRRRPVDLGVTLAGIPLPNPVIAASGTFGYGDEVARLCPPAQLGAVTVKSLVPYEWPGNRAPRVAPVDAGMMNAIGLPGPGVETWIREDLPLLAAHGGRIIGSIWGRSIADYALAAKQMNAVADQLIAIEVNISCPNVEARGDIFAHSVSATREAVAAARDAIDIPMFVKLSPNVTSVVEIADAAIAAGADGLTCFNTVLGLSIDPSTRRPRLGNGGGGLSGPAVRPIAVRGVHEIRRAFPDIPIIGTGGIATGADAAEMLVAGANAIGVGTATFQDPRATLRILKELRGWCAIEGVARVTDLVNTMQEPQS